MPPPKALRIVTEAELPVISRQVIGRFVSAELSRIDADSDAAVHIVPLLGRVVAQYDVAPRLALDSRVEALLNQLQVFLVALGGEGDRVLTRHV